MKKIRRWLRNLVKTKAFHISIIVIIVLALISFACITIIKYNKKGETKMPFEVSKIEVISSVTGEETGEQTTDRWHLNVSQNNDFYIYIEKNNEYKGRTQEAIESVVIDNIEISKNNPQGENVIYKPDAESEKEIFKNVDQNKVEKIEYMGAPESKVKQMQMSNQGDLIYFRFTNKNIAKFVSNDEELNYSEILKKLGTKEEDLKATIKFDMTIKLASRKEFKTTVNTQVPLQGVVEKGTSSGEIIDVNELIFKRN